MANVLRFDPARRPQAPRGGATKGPAVILFFTGVRYERGAAETTVRKPAPRPGKRGGPASAEIISDAGA